MTTNSDHPRPFLQRPWTSLDGTWDWSIDSGDRHRGPGDPAFEETIVVPFAPETAASTVEATGFVQQCWYRRTLDIEAPASDERVLVHFGGVDRIADVWVDGHHLANHVGGYAPFSVDITDHAKPGAELVVRASDDGHDLSVPRGKQDWNEVPHAVWYPRTTGIWKTVWFERVAQTHVADIIWTADVPAMSVTAHVTVAGPIDDSTRLSVTLSAHGRTLVDDDMAVTDRTMTRTFALGDGGFDDRFALLWWPRSPTLIEAEITLHAGEVTIDEVSSYTALRSVEVSDGTFLLNGRPYPLRLVLDQGYWPDTGATPPSVEALREDIELTRALGFNGARKHQKTEDARYFSLADRLGIVTWVEMPSAYRPGAASAASLASEWAAIVAAHRNHPSVIVWVPVNESWGVPACEQDPRQRAVIDSLRALTVALDGTRPVSANDGWETSGGDIVGIHDYEQDPSVLAARWGSNAAVDAVLTARRSDGKLADLDRRPAGNRAVVLSEFGGIALTTDTAGATIGLGSEHWGYDNAADEDDFLGRYRALWAAVHASPNLAGACWTQLADVHQEVNGLVRADRTPKGDLTQLNAATRGR